jgi:hypothetical protein
LRRPQARAPVERVHRYVIEEIDFLRDTATLFTVYFDEKGMKVRQS